MFWLRNKKINFLLCSLNKRLVNSNANSIQDSGQGRVFLNDLPYLNSFAELLFCHLRIFFVKSSLLKSYFRNTFRVSIRLDPDQSRRFFGPDLYTNCVQRLSADDTSWQRVKVRKK